MAKKSRPGFGGRDRETNDGPPAGTPPGWKSKPLAGPKKSRPGKTGRKGC